MDKSAAGPSAALRQIVLSCLGEFPPLVDPQPQTLETISLADHAREVVTYFVEPGEKVTALLLVPRKPAGLRAGKLHGPAPGILALHQHNGEFHLGKSEPAGLAGDPTMHYGLELCRRGFVVMCPDHLCFEDRRPSEKERRGNPYLQDASYERFEATKRFLEGSSLQAKYLSDLSRAADVLAMRPEVDADRLGTIGHSLGGQEALWLCWYDERIKAGVSSCGFSLISCILRDRINHNMAMYAPGLLKVCDLDEILASIAPRAFMMINGRDDRIFPADGVERTAKRAREVYNSLGAGDRFSSITFPGGHSFPAEMRSAAYESLSRWLGASGAKSQAGS